MGLVVVAVVMITYQCQARPLWNVRALRTCQSYVSLFIFFSCYWRFPGLGFLCVYVCCLVPAECHNRLPHPPNSVFNERLGQRHAVVLPSRLNECFDSFSLFFGKSCFCTCPPDSYNHSSWSSQDHLPIYPDVQQCSLQHILPKGQRTYLESTCRKVTQQSSQFFYSGMRQQPKG